MKKYNDRLGLLSLIVALLVAVFTVNLPLTDDPTVFLLFFAVLGGVSAWLITAKSGTVLLLASAVGWAVTMLLTKNAVSALLSVSYLPFAFALSFIPKRRLTRSGAIGIASGTVTVTAVLAIIYITYVKTDTVSLTSVIDAFPSFFGQVEKLLCSSFYVSIAGEDVSIIDKSNVNGYLSVLICIAPAVISAVSTVMGFVVGWIYKKLIEITAVGEIDSTDWMLIPSSVSAAVFLVSALMAAVICTTNAFSLAFLNLAVILTPGILMAGLLSAFTPIRTNGVERPRLLRPIMLIITFLSSLVAFALLCVFYGVYDSFKAAFPKRKPNN